MKKLHAGHPFIFAVLIGIWFVFAVAAVGATAAGQAAGLCIGLNVVALAAIIAWMAVRVSFDDPQDDDDARDELRDDRT
jgi:amino acid transporter